MKTIQCAWKFSTGAAVVSPFIEAVCHMAAWDSDCGVNSLATVRSTFVRKQLGIGLENSAATDDLIRSKLWIQLGLSLRMWPCHSSVTSKIGTRFVCSHKPASMAYQSFPLRDIPLVLDRQSEVFLLEYTQKSCSISLPWSPRLQF